MSKSPTDEIEATIMALAGRVDRQTSPDLPEPVSRRLGSCQAVARANADKMNTTLQTHSARLLAQSIHSGRSSRAKRFVWLRRAADAMGRAAGPHAACRPGCSHCCHIPVKISRSEALEIGRAIGLQPVAAPQARQHSPDYSDPCSFLRSGRCSIYGDRPVACRTHFNLDADALLCELHGGSTVQVPGLDTRHFVMANLVISGATDALADIRDWFPGSLVDPLITAQNFAYHINDGK